MIVTKRERSIVQALYYDIVYNQIIIRACTYYGFRDGSFGHYHQAPGASCGILYILVLSLVLFMQSLYPLSEIFHLLVSFSFSLLLAVRVIECNIDNK